METKVLTLPGGYIRLEPLEQRHRDGLSAAAGIDPSLYQWSPVPQGTYETKQYVATALSWQDAGTAIPFAIVREHDRIVLGSTRFWNLGRLLWPPGHFRPGRLPADACEMGYTWLSYFVNRTVYYTH